MWARTHCFSIGERKRSPGNVRGPVTWLVNRHVHASLNPAGTAQATLANSVPSTQVLGSSQVLQLPFTSVSFLLCASLLKDVTVTHLTNLLLCAGCMIILGWAGEQGLDPLSPLCHSWSQVEDVLDSPSLLCPSWSLIKACFQVPGSLGPIPQAAERGGCPRSARFRPLWMVGDNKQKWVEKEAALGDNECYFFHYRVQIYCNPFWKAVTLSGVMKCSV